MERKAFSVLVAVLWFGQILSSSSTVAGRMKATVFYI